MTAQAAFFDTVALVPGGLQRDELVDEVHQGVVIAGHGGIGCVFPVNDHSWHAGDSIAPGEIISPL